MKPKSLLERVRRTVSPERETPAEEPFLPFDAVRELLSAHPLVHALGVEARAVHEAILDLGKSTQRDVTTCPPPTHRAFDCPTCAKGFVVLDVQTGTHLCERCGAVACDQVLQVEYIPRCFDGTAVNRAFLPDVASLATPSVPKTSFADVTHWNQFVRVSSASLDSVVRFVDAWPGRRVHPYPVRVAAALLSVHMADHFLNESEMRRQLRRGEGLVKLETTVPRPQFPCPSCDVRCHDIKTARFHCRPFGRKRPR